MLMDTVWVHRGVQCLDAALFGDILFFYSGLEIVSEEVEDPFGFDPDDLPVEPLTADIEKSYWRQLKNQDHAWAIM